MHQHLVAGHDTADRLDGMDGGRQHHRERRRLFGREARLVLDRGTGGHLDVLGIGATDGQTGQHEARRGDGRAVVDLGVIGRVTGDDDHPLADREFGDARAQLGDLAGGVDAEDVREGKLGDDRAFADVMVEPVDAGGEHLNQHMAGPRLGRRDVFELEHGGIAEFADDGCFHRLSPV